MKSTASPSRPRRVRRTCACGAASSASSSGQHTANASSPTLPTPLPKASPGALAGEGVSPGPWGPGHVFRWLHLPLTQVFFPSSPGPILLCPSPDVDGNDLMSYWPALGECEVHPCSLQKWGSERKLGFDINKDAANNNQPDLALTSGDENSLTQTQRQRKGNGSEQAGQAGLACLGLM